jgi:hypothetical protein
MNEGYTTLSTTQENILRILEETGGLTLIDFAKMLQMKMVQLEVEVAKLRHMKKVFHPIAERANENEGQ